VFKGSEVGGKDKLGIETNGRNNQCMQNFGVEIFCKPAACSYKKWKSRAMGLRKTDCGDGSTT
jgi:hypothetical protein